MKLNIFLSNMLLLGQILFRGLTLKWWFQWCEILDKDVDAVMFMDPFEKEGRLKKKHPERTPTESSNIGPWCCCYGPWSENHVWKPLQRRRHRFTSWFRRMIFLMGGGAGSGGLHVLSTCAWVFGSYCSFTYCSQHQDWDLDEFRVKCIFFIQRSGKNQTSHRRSQNRREISYRVIHWLIRQWGGGVGGGGGYQSQLEKVLTEHCGPTLRGR